MDLHHSVGYNGGKIEPYAYGITRTITITDSEAGTKTYTVLPDGLMPEAGTIHVGYRQHFNLAVGALLQPADAPRDWLDDMPDRDGEGENCLDAIFAWRDECAKHNKPVTYRQIANKVNLSLGYVKQLGAKYQQEHKEHPQTD